LKASMTLLPLLSCNKTFDFFKK